MTTWRIDATDTGNEPRPPFEHIKNFYAGLPRAFRRTIAGIPATNPMVGFIWRVRKSRRSDAELVFEKVVNTTYNLAQGQVENIGDAGGLATVSLLTYGVETAPLVRKAYFEGLAVLADGSRFIACQGTIAGLKSLEDNPSQVPLPASRISVSPNPLSVSVGASVLATFTVTDIVGAVVPGAVVGFASSNSAVLALGATTGVTDANGQVKVSVVGAGIGTANLTATIGDLVFSTALTPAAPAPAASIVANKSTIGLSQGGASDTIIFTLHDAGGNPTAGTISVASTVAGAGSVTPASGPSPLTVTCAPGAGGSGSIHATAAGGLSLDVPLATTAAVDHVDVDDGDADNAVTIGAGATATAVPRDVANNALARPVVFGTLSGGSTVLNVNSATGVWTGAGVGTDRITATSGGVTGQSSLITVSAADAFDTFYAAVKTWLAIGGADDGTKIGAALDMTKLAPTLNADGITLDSIHDARGAGFWPDLLPVGGASGRAGWNAGLKAATVDGVAQHMRNAVAQTGKIPAAPTRLLVLAVGWQESGHMVAVLEGYDNAYQVGPFDTHPADGNLYASAVEGYDVNLGVASGTTIRGAWAEVSGTTLKGAVVDHAIQTIGFATPGMPNEASGWFVALGKMFGGFGKGGVKALWIIDASGAATAFAADATIRAAFKSYALALGATSAA